MPRLLIAGCGYLGQAVAELFRAEDWFVEGWTNSRESATQLSTKLDSAEAIDLSDRAALAGRVGDFDLILQAASTRGGDADCYRRVYLDGARNLLARFSPAKVFFVSSTSVYSQASGEWVTEDSVAEPATETGKILREAEKLVLANNGIVLRLGGIYGPNRSALLAKFLRGEAMIDPDNDRFLNAIHRDDAAAALRFLARRSESCGEIYNLVDNEPTLQSECYRWLAARLGRPIPPTGRSTTARKRGASNKRVSNAKLRAAGWAPRYPNFASGMSESVLASFTPERP
jgi:nucleoside-diphosphate-sugar epimerase